MTSYKFWTEEEVETLRQMATNGYKDKEIARKLNKTENAVSSKRYSEDIEQVKINEKLFKKWTHQNSWLLGLITADGTFSRKNTITITNTNKNFLEKAKQIYETRNKITINKSNRYGNKTVYVLSINNDEIINSIKKLNGYGNKEERNPFKVIPNKYKWSFIRGLFDGDGNFYKGTISIAGRRNLIKEIYYWLCLQINKKPNKVYQSSCSDKTYYFQISKQDSKDIIDLLNKNIGDLFISKKHNKINNYFN